MKKTVLLIAMVLKSINSIAQCQANVLDSLVAHWGFNGSVADLSGNGHNGIIVGTVIDTTNRCSNLNSSYTNWSLNNYISVPDAQVLRLNNMDFTISAWVYMLDTLSSSIYGGQVIIDKRTSTGNGNYGWSLGIVASQRRPQFNISGGSSYSLVSNSQIELNCWNYIVVEYINTTHRANLFINGLLDSNSAILATPNFNNNASVRIGNDVAGYNYDFHGRIDDIRIYNRTLDSCSIDSLYRQCQFLHCSTLNSVNDLIFPSLLQISPMPNNGTFKVVINEIPFVKATLILRSITGQKVKEIQLIDKTTEIDLNVESGIYLVTILGLKGNYTSKIIIQR